MPNFITHSIHGMKVLNLSLSQASAAFLVGCQGADIFFYKYSKYGRILHERSSEVFLQHLVKNSRTEIQKLYSIGYMCHTTLDDIAHPYINYRTHTPAEHTKFEFILDTILLEKVLKKGWGYNFVKHLEIEKDTLEQVSELYVETLRDVFEIEISKEEVEKSYRSMMRILKFFHDPLRLKMFIVYLVKWLTFNKFDYTFMIHPVVDDKNFPDPLNLKGNFYQNKTFFEILDEATIRAQKLKDQLFSKTFW